MQWWCAAQGAAWTWGWRAYPGVWAFLILLAGAYLLLCRSAGAGEGRPATRGRTGSFAAGLLVLWLALDWPLGALGGGYLASAHMIQFLLVALVAPPLLLFGLPEAAFAGVRRRPALLAALHGATHPLLALVLFDAVVFATHFPPLVDALMASQAGAFALDMAWLGAGLLFWWPVAAPLPERSWFHPMVKVGYLGAQMIAMTPLFFWLAFAELPVYATFELAPRVHSISARDDQHVAGILMKVGGMLITLAAVGVVFLRWAGRTERTSPAGEPR